jgi:hypothetical protein
MIRHVVMLKFADSADAAEAKERLDALVGVVPELLSLQVDLDVLHTAASWDLALVSTHEDLQGLRAYQAHPAHAAFGEWLGPRVSARASVDAEV